MIHFPSPSALPSYHSITTNELPQIRSEKQRGEKDKQWLGLRAGLSGVEDGQHLLLFASCCHPNTNIAELLSFLRHASWSAKIIANYQLQIIFLQIFYNLKSCLEAVRRRGSRRGGFIDFDATMMKYYCTLTYARGR